MFGWLPNVTAVLPLALAQCVRPVDVYRAVSWESVVLVAGMVPLAAGGHRVKDFTRVGLPLQLLVLATALIVVPLVWPF